MGNHRSNSAGIDPRSGELMDSAQAFHEQLQKINPDLAAERIARRSPGAGTETRNNPDALPSRCTMCAGTGHVTQQDALIYAHKVGLSSPQGQSGEDMRAALEGTGALHSNPVGPDGRVRLNRGVIGMSNAGEVNNTLLSLFGIAPFPFNSVEDYAEHHGYDLDEIMEKRKWTHDAKSETLGNSHATEFGVTCPHCHGVGVCSTCSGNKRDDIVNPQFHEAGLNASRNMLSAREIIDMQAWRPATTIIPQASLEQQGAIPRTPEDRAAYIAAQKKAENLETTTRDAQAGLIDIGEKYDVTGLDVDEILPKLREIREGGRQFIDLQDIFDGEKHLKTIHDNKKLMSMLAPMLALRPSFQTAGARPLISPDAPLRDEEGKLAFRPYSAEEKREMRAQMPPPQRGAVVSAAPPPVLPSRPAGEIPEGLEGASGWDLQGQLDTQGLGQTIEDQEAQRASLRDLAVDWGRRHWESPSVDVSPNRPWPIHTQAFDRANEEIQQLRAGESAASPEGGRVGVRETTFDPAVSKPSSTGISDTEADIRERRRQFLTGPSAPVAREIIDPEEAALYGLPKRRSGGRPKLGIKGTYGTVPTNLLPGGGREPFDPQRDIRVMRQTPMGAVATPLPREPTQLERVRGVRPPTRPISSPAVRAMKTLDELRARNTAALAREQRMEQVKREQAEEQRQAEEERKAAEQRRQEQEAKVQRSKEQPEKKTLRLTPDKRKKRLSKLLAERRARRKSRES